MGEAFAWGIVASSSLLLGGLIALRFRISSRTLGVVMAFGAGVLISAVAYELVGEAFDIADGAGMIALGLFAGCAAFSLGDGLIDRLGGASRKHSRGDQASGSPLAIVLGLTVLTTGSVSVAFLVAVFLSNLPEAVAATSGLVAARWRRSRVLGLWGAVMLTSGLAALAGYGLLENASPTTIAFINAFAGGAILTMLADTMMPEAFEHGGKLVGIFTTLGFAVAFAITALE